MDHTIKSCKSAHPYPDDYTGDDDHNENGQVNTIDPDRDDHNRTPDDNSFAPNCESRARPATGTSTERATWSKPRTTWTAQMMS